MRGAKLNGYPDEDDDGPAAKLRMGLARREPALPFELETESLKVEVVDIVSILDSLDAIVVEDEAWL